MNTINTGNTKAERLVAKGQAVVDHWLEAYEAVERDYHCEYGHQGDSTEDGGVCVDELLGLVEVNKREAKLEEDRAYYDSLLLVRGGRSGRKIHRAHKGSSSTDCGKWLKAAVAHFRAGDYTLAMLEKFEPHLCEACFPNGIPAPIREFAAAEAARAERLGDAKPAPQVVGLDAAKVTLSAPKDATFTLRREGNPVAGTITPETIVVQIRRTTRVLAATRGMIQLADDLLAGLSREAMNDAERGLYDRLELGTIELRTALEDLSRPADGATVPGSLPELLAQERKARGLSFDEWANLLGVHQATVRRWEGGATVPGLGDLQRIARAGVDPRLLLSVPVKALESSTTT